MTTIPINITVQPDGIAVVHLPADLPPGEYGGTLDIDTATEDRARPGPLPPLDLKPVDMSAWPTTSTFRREDLYDDDGR